MFSQTLSLLPQQVFWPPLLDQRQGHSLTSKVHFPLILKILIMLCKLGTILGASQISHAFWIGFLNSTSLSFGYHMMKEGPSTFEDLYLEWAMFKENQDVTSEVCVNWCGWQSLQYETVGLIFECILIAGIVCRSYVDWYWLTISVPMFLSSLTFPEAIWYQLCSDFSFVDSWCVLVRIQVVFAGYRNCLSFL